MSLELLLIFIVALVVFGPNKLPVLAQHLARFLQIIAGMKQSIVAELEQAVKQKTLQDNEKKARLADAHYEKDET